MRKEPLSVDSEIGQEIAAQFVEHAEQHEASAWEEVTTGRFMPRRIKGSCKGRALG